MPSRRALLRTCGAALGLGVAGCLSSDGGTPPMGGATGDETTRSGATTGTTPTTAETASTTDGTATTSKTAELTVPTGPPPEVREVDPATVDRGVPRSPTIESERHDPFRAFVVGERPATPGSHFETPHAWVWNLTGGRRVVELALTTGKTELLRNSFEFPAGAPLALAFRDRRAYELMVRAGGREKTVPVERDRFFCNDSATDVLLTDDGIEAETVSTSMYCTTRP